VKKGRRYPWDDWFSKKQFRLVRGKQYTCEPNVMAQQVRNAARSRTTKVSIQRAGDILLVTNWGEDT